MRKKQSLKALLFFFLKMRQPLGDEHILKTETEIPTRENLVSKEECNLMYRSPFRAKARMTTRFKKPGDWAAGYHTGEDWVCDTDRTLVSPANGTIIYNGYDKSYGYNIIIRTDDNKVIRMCHLAEKSPAYGKVKAGEVVGTMGNTGNSYGAHLHIEVEDSPTWHYNKNLLKPSDYIDFNNWGQNNDSGDEEDEEVIYKTISDVPEWYREAVQRRYDLGVFDGKNIPETMARMWTIEDRINPFYANLDDVPEYWREDTKKLIEEGKIKGDGKNEVGKYRWELAAIIAATR